MGAIRHFVPQLEEHFVVVHCTQRGAGKSYSHELSAESMTVERFGRRKLFLVGQSWGTGLCMRLLKRRPDLVRLVNHAAVEPLLRSLADEGDLATRASLAERIMAEARPFLV